MSAASKTIDRGRQSRTEGNLPEARKFYAEAARLYREQNHSLAYAHTIRHIADIHRKEGSFSEARPLYEEALELYRKNHDTKLLDLGLRYVLTYVIHVAVRIAVADRASSTTPQTSRSLGDGLLEVR